jgi:hypothetical protein
VTLYPPGADRITPRCSGLLHLPRLARITAPQRETLRVRDVATPWARCITCAPDDLLGEVLEKLSPGRGPPILVTDGQHLAGITDGDTAVDHPGGLWGAWEQAWSRLPSGPRHHP